MACKMAPSLSSLGLSRLVSSGGKEEPMTQNYALGGDFDTEELNFRTALISLSEAFARKGYRVRPLRERAWSDFLAFPQEKRRKIMRDFSSIILFICPYCWRGDPQTKMAASSGPR
jgi:hypothetical protein